MAQDTLTEPPQRSALTWRREAAAVPAQATALRRSFASWLGEWGVPAGFADDAQLAVYEALANAADHAYPEGVDGTMALTATVERDAFVVSVSDWGRWIEPPTVTRRGRGLHLMRGLAHEVTIATSATGTTVTLRWHVS